MPDLLGATNPVPGYDKSLNNNRIPQTAPENPHIQNAPDLSKVNRADRRTDRQDSNLQGDGPIRYDSNFQTFLQRLRAAPSMSESLSRLFAGERTVVLSGMSEGVAAEMSKAFELLEMDEGQLLEFLKGQMRAGTRFGGALFALLRGAYARASSDAVQTDILKFLKSYADFSSTAHIEGNLLRELRGMADTMPASWGAKLHELLAQLENGIAAGDREGNLALLQKGVIPYMSEYVERTHDMGTPRELLTMLTLNVARYQNGSVENLLELFHQLGGYGTLKGQLEGIDDQSLLMLLKGGPGRAVRGSPLRRRGCRPPGRGQRRRAADLPQPRQRHAGQRERVYAHQPLPAPLGMERADALFRAVGGPRRGKRPRRRLRPEGARHEAAL